jgi:hypothetical protein
VNELRGVAELMNCCEHGGERQAKARFPAEASFQSHFQVALKEGAFSTLLPHQSQAPPPVQGVGAAPNNVWLREK